MSLLRTAAVLVSLATSISAHGHVQGIIANNTYYLGYTPAFGLEHPPPNLAAWSIPTNWDGGFIGPVNYSNPDIICHRNATPGATSVKVEAGQVVELQWGIWPNGHHGPVLDYLAKCPGSCTDVDKTQLEFFKIDEGGFVHNSSLPKGWWATSSLEYNNYTWTVAIPRQIQPGNYVLRHEIIALHVAGDLNGAQNYPQCVNLEITGEGLENPPGVPATDLYKATDTGIFINIWTQLIPTYTIPGPSLYSNAILMSQTLLTADTYATPNYGPIAPTSTTTSLTGVDDTLYAEPTDTTSAGSTDAPATPTATPTPTAASSTTTTTTTPTFTYAPSTSTIVLTSTVTAVPPPSSSTADDTTCTHPTPTEPPPTSQIADIASSVPSQDLTAPVPVPSVSSTPTPAPAPSSAYQWGSKPAKPLPPGYTLQDLLEWTAFLVQKSWKAAQRGGKAHQRDFVRRG